MALSPEFPRFGQLQCKQYTSPQSRHKCRERRGSNSLTYRKNVRLSFFPFFSFNYRYRERAKNVGNHAKGSTSKSKETSWIAPNSDGRERSFHKKPSGCFVQKNRTQLLGRYKYRLFSISSTTKPVQKAELELSAVNTAFVVNSRENLLLQI